MLTNLSRRAQRDLNDFIAAGAKNRSAQDLFCFRINTDFHETLNLTFFISPAHPAHRIFRTECTTSGLPYFIVCHAATT